MPTDTSRYTLGRVVRIIVETTDNVPNLVFYGGACTIEMIRNFVDFLDWSRNDSGQQVFTGQTVKIELRQNPMQHYDNESAFDYSYDRMEDIPGIQRVETATADEVESADDIIRVIRGDISENIE